MFWHWCVGIIFQTKRLPFGERKKKDVSTMNKDWLSRHSSVYVSGIVQTARHLLLPSICISVSGPSINIKQDFDPF